MTTTFLPPVGKVESAETADSADDSAVLAGTKPTVDDTVCIFEVLEEMQRIIDSYREPDPQPKPARPLPSAVKADVELQS